MKFFKGLALTIVLIFAVGGMILFYIGGSVFMVGSAIKSEANKPVIQQISTTNGTQIEVSLKEEYSLSFKNIELCTPDDKKENHFFKKVDAGAYGTSFSCFNKICEINISLDNLTTYPKNVDMYVLNNNTCEKKTFTSSDGEVGISGYTSRIEMSEELLNILNLGESYSAKPKFSMSHSAWQFMGTKKIDMNYKTKPASEILIVDGKEVAEIKFK